MSPTRTRNYILGDPLPDWLELYGEAHGFERDSSFPQYDSRTDFTEFLFRCYNEVDCKVMMEIVWYLRENH